MARRGDHIPDFWFERAKLYATMFGVEAIVGLEAGGEAVRRCTIMCKVASAFTPSRPKKVSVG